MNPITPDEWICICIARQVTDGEVLAQGINTPLVMAGYILAKLTHAPNVQFASAIAQGICQAWSPLSITHNEDFWLRESLMNVGFATATSDLLPAYAPKEFFRPAQIDSRGNFNNIAFGDYAHPTLRLPGAGGIPDVSVYSDHIYLYVPRHSRVTFVKQVDYVSGLGHSDQRKRGAGARYLVSDLGEFDWHNNGHIRLLRHRPDVSIDRIRAKTGFELQIAPDVHPITPPTDEELRLLREVIDPLNIRKLETLGGAERKALLRQIIEAERR